MIEPDAIGRRVRYWRERRRMTRCIFASLLDRSESWVEKVESGTRKLDRLSVLSQIAHALNVPFDVLVNDEAFRRHAQCVDAPEIAAIRTALQVPVTMPGPEPDLAGLRRRVDYAWLAFQSCDYSHLGPALAGLATQAEQATAQLDGDDALSAAVLRAQVHQVITSTVRKLGHYDLEWVAADRGMRAAEDIDDALVFGGAAMRLVNALRDNNGATAAVTLTGTAAARLSRQVGLSRIEVRSVYGCLLLQGAMSAAEAGNSTAATDLLTEAGSIAATVGEGRNDYHTAFGPTNVVIHRVAAFVELDEWEKALAVADQLDLEHFVGMPRERRANHLLDLARAYALGGHRDDAVWHLLEADELAPREIRCRPVARELVIDLVRGTRARPSGDLHRLAARVGVPV